VSPPIQVQTSRFGPVEAQTEDIITFTQPIVGFSQHRRFLLLPGPGPFLKWLQSSESAELAFIVMDPRAVVPDYTVKLRPDDLNELGVASAEELDLYTLVVVPEDHTKIRTNLKAPLLINPSQQLGKQMIMDKSDYPVQFFLAQASPGDASQEEVSNARSNS
jgi:flagellar assembly factor FliW